MGSHLPCSRTVVQVGRIADEQQKEAAEAASFLKILACQPKLDGDGQGSPSRLRRYGGQPSPWNESQGWLAKPKLAPVIRGAKAGVRQEARTPDLRVANAALSQLS